MSSPDFSLAPWETESDLPTTGSVSIQHAGYDMSLQMGQLWIRKTDASKEGSFIATSLAEAPFLNSWLTTLGWGQYEPMAWRTSLNDILAKGKLARVFFLGPTGKLRQPKEKATHLVLLGAGGWAKWQRCGGEIQGNQAVFLWTHEPNLPRFLNTLSLDIWAQIQAQWADENSECAFARRLMDLSGSQIKDLIWNWTDAQISEATELLTWWFQMQTDYWENTRALFASVSLPQPDSQGKYNISLSRGLLTGGMDELPTGTFEKAFQFLLDRFGSPWNEDIVERQLCIRRWMEGKPQKLILHVRAPTAHEQLEASLNWRDWINSAP